MSTMYELELADVITSEHLEQIARRATASEDGKDAGPTTILADVFINPTREPDVLTDAFGLESAAVVGMEMLRDHDPDIQLRDMVRIVMGVLNEVSCDAVLHYELGTVWLVRQDGKLTLSDKDDLWTPDLMELVTIPYERAPLIVP